MEGEQQVRCPLCDGTYEGGAAYTAHLRDAHHLLDHEVAEADDGPGAGSGALDLGVLAAAAASLAAAEEPLPVPPAPAPAHRAQPTPVAPWSPARRRGLAAVLAAAVLAVAVWLAGSGDDPAPVAGDSERSGLADGGIGPGNGLVEVGGTSVLPSTTATPGATVATAPVTTTSPGSTDPDTQPRTTQPGSSPSTGPTTSTTTSPSPTTTTTSTTTTTTPPTSVRATEASVVSCTEVAGDRTLVYSFVLSGSTSDGRHELTVTFPVSSGPIVVSAVNATEAGGRTVIVPLQPGPVLCD